MTLSHLGLEGRRKIGFNIANAKEFKLINQSITGLFENNIDLFSSYELMNNCYFK